MRIGDDVRVFDGSVIRVPRFSPEDKARVEAMQAQFGGMISAHHTQAGVVVEWSGLGHVSVRASTMADALKGLREGIEMHLSQIA
jgi:3-dehydroquinate dehydratase